MNSVTREFMEHTNLDWEETPNNGICGSGWSPLHNRHYHVDIDDNIISLTIEPRTPGSCACAIASIFPFLLPVLYGLMAAQVNAKKLTFYINPETGKVDLLCRSKSAFQEETPVTLHSIQSLNFHSRGFEDSNDLVEEEEEEEQFCMVDIIIQHEAGVHAISIESDKKLGPFIEAVQALLATVNNRVDGKSSSDRD